MGLFAERVNIKEKPPPQSGQGLPEVPRYSSEGTICLPAFLLVGKNICSVAAAATTPTILPPHWEPASSALQYRLKTSGSPGILQIFSTSLVD